MNQACRDLFGIDENQDITGLTDEDLLPSDRAEAARSDDRHVIETKEPIEIEETVPTADGETVRLTRKSPVCDEEGAVEAICGVSSDVTAQRERERELEFYERIINAFDDIVTVIEPDGTITYVSPSVRRVLGYDPEDLIGENGYKYQPQETTEAVETAIQGVIEHPEESRTTQTKFQRSDGSMCWIEFKIQNRLDDDAIDGLLVNSRDITARKEYERTLERQRNNLEILNQVVRHDIRNDMTVVGGRANLLEEHVETEGREDLEAIQNATKSAIELTKTARDLSEVMLSTEEDVEPVRLDRHLDPSIENARSKFDTAVITTEDQIPDVRVRGNDLIEAVFRNLIQNAVVHNDKERPEVQISTALDEGTATVAIADNGPGIPDDRKETIFGKGEKGLDSPGTGLGLYLVRTLVEQYGGDIWVEDNDPEGSVFYVELPIAEEL
jgi:PAS domain S-box-containing protein